MKPAQSKRVVPAPDDKRPNHEDKRDEPLPELPDGPRPRAPVDEPGGPEDHPRPKKIARAAKR